MIESTLICNNLHMNTRFFAIVIAVVAVIIAGIMAWVYWGTEPTGERGEQNGGQLVQGEIVTRRGEYVCLPAREGSATTTTECAFGLKSEDGTHYALNTMVLETDELAATPAGTMITVTGRLTPIADVPEDDQAHRYDVVGVILVTGVDVEGDGVVAGQTVTAGAITLRYPDDFSMAVAPEHIVVESTIPPCDEEFYYCLYYGGTAYENTNFDSAGVRVAMRDDLGSRDACLTAPPAGQTGVEPVMETHDTYATAVFNTEGGGAAGHYATGNVYRLALGATCYEFETRIAAAQFENYAPGTIEEFTASQSQDLQEKFNGILDSVTVRASGEAVSFPVPGK